MNDDEERNAPLDNMILRRERVVRTVLARIGDMEQAVGTKRPPLINLAVWTIPVLVAASVVLLMSGRMMIRPGAAEPRRNTAAEWLGLPPPVARYLETGQVSTADWLDNFGDQR